MFSFQIVHSYSSCLSLVKLSQIEPIHISNYKFQNQGVCPDDKRILRFLCYFISTNYKTFFKMRPMITHVKVKAGRKCFL